MKYCYWKFPYVAVIAMGFIPVKFNVFITMVFPPLLLSLIASLLLELIILFHKSKKRINFPTLLIGLMLRKVLGYYEFVVNNFL